MAKISLTAYLPDAVILAREAALAEELIRRALEKKIRRTRGELIVRTILPTDLEFPVMVWRQSVTANTWVATVDFTVPEDAVIGLVRIKSKLPEPLTTFIKVWKNITPITVMHAENIKNIENRELVFETPIIYDPEQKIKIEQYASATGTDEIIFIGLICEPRTVRITGQTGWQSSR